MTDDNEWTTEELRAAVLSYLEMRERQRAGERYVKKAYYRDLASRWGRTEKAWEYRAQNISHVLALQGREWIPGLLPAKNVGSKVIAQIEELLAQIEGVPNTEEAAFESRVRSAQSRMSKEIPHGVREPAASVGKNVVFERDPEVKAWVLNEARGVCESCGSKAPFVTFDNEPFLEVHHVRRLADGGSDTVTNAVALCPNCHRAMHHSIDKDDRVARLHLKVERLIRE